MLISRYIVFLFLSVYAQQQKDDLYAQVDTNLLFVDIVGSQGIESRREPLSLCRTELESNLAYIGVGGILHFQFP